MELTSGNIRLRGFRKSDSKKIAALANNENISKNLRDFFPSPYSENDAEVFILLCQAEDPQVAFIIEYRGEPAGCISLVIQKDIYKKSAEIGYWIGEPFWGKGIATEAVKLVVEYGFDHLELVRIFTGVFDFNKASQKVLEKAGFYLECISKKSVYKSGRILDEYKYAKIKDK
ncbi:MAG: GNAT family protein [Acidobacteriota bacterium]